MNQLISECWLAWCAKTTYLAHYWCMQYKNLARVWCTKSLPKI